MSDILCSHPIYSYISTLAGYDPVRTYYVCAPEEDAASLDSLARFAEVSGWREAAQQRGAVLVMPGTASRPAAAKPSGAARAGFGAGKR